MKSPGANVQSSLSIWQSFQVLILSKSAFIAVLFHFIDPCQEPVHGFSFINNGWCSIFQIKLVMLKVGSFFLNISQVLSCLTAAFFITFRHVSCTYVLWTCTVLLLYIFKDKDSPNRHMEDKVNMVMFSFNL